MSTRACLFLALIALANSQRFRRTPTALATSTYGTSPIVSASAVPSLSAVATLSASPSGSRSPRPSTSSLPSVSVSRSPHLSSSSTTTPRSSAEPSKSFLSTSSATFSVSASASISASITRTPSVSPSISSTPCNLWYEKITPDYQPCNPGGSQTIHSANMASITLIGVLIVGTLFLIAITGVIYSGVHVNQAYICESDCKKRPCTHCIGLTFSILCCFLPLILIIMFGTIEGYDQTPYKIASGVLLGSWIFFVFCFAPIIIFIEYCCVEIYKAYQRDRDWCIQWNAERQRRRILRCNPPQIVEQPPIVEQPQIVEQPPTKVFVNTDPTCTICFANMPEKAEETTDKEEERTTLPCGHEFHSGCVSGWHAQRLAEFPSEPASCPICRANLHGHSGGAK